MFEKLKKFFKWLFESENIVIAKPAGIEPPTPQPKKYDEEKPFFHPNNQQAFDRGVEKTIHQLRQNRIREQNLKRQKATMGSNLNSKLFKPRSGHEKRNFDIRKKPEDD